MASFDVVNMRSEKVGQIDLDDAVFAAPINEHLFYEVLKMRHANQRAGTHAVKNRSLVSGGGKKPYKQKGTGQARQGSIRASQWVGGGKAMGPKPRDYSYRVPSKVRKGALRSALSLRAREGKLAILDAFQLGEVKTKQAAAALVGFKLGKTLVVEERSNDSAHRAIRNLSSHAVRSPESVSVFDLLGHEGLVLTQAAAKKLEEALRP